MGDLAFALANPPDHHHSTPVTQPAPNTLIPHPTPAGELPTNGSPPLTTTHHHHCACPATPAIPTTTERSCTLYWLCARGTSQSRPPPGLHYRLPTLDGRLINPRSDQPSADPNAQLPPGSILPQSTVAGSNSTDGFARTQPTAMMSRAQHAQRPRKVRAMERQTTRSPYNSYASRPAAAHPRRCQSKVVVHFNPSICTCTYDQTKG